MSGIAIAEQPKLGTISRKVYHDCVKPETIVSTEIYTTGRWWWKKSHVIRKFKEDFDFTCVCGSKWEWKNNLLTDGGYWFARSRTYETIKETV